MTAGNNATAYGVGSARIELSPVPVQAKRPPTTNDTSFEIGTTWIDTVGKDAYILVNNAGGVATWNLSAVTPGQVATLTGDAGGAIAPLAGNINIVGGNLSTVVGAGNTLTITELAGAYPITPYVVSSVVGNAGYLTVQSAINAAGAAGGGSVYIQPGTYTENLTLIAGVHIYGTGIGNTIISGVHTPPAGAGLVVFQDISLTSATHIFSSAAAGACNITLQTVEVNCTNGFTFNLANWTGALSAFSTADVSTNNGFVTNTGGATISTANSDIGRGAGQTLVCSGPFISQASSIHCPVSFVTGAISVAIDQDTIDRTITFSNNSSGYIDQSHFSTGATAALTQSSAGTIELSDCVITSSNNPAIAGAGAGVITLTGVDFTSNSNIAGTLTTAAGVSRGGNFISQFIAGTSPDAHYQTVQTAITACGAAGGGTVYVKPGTYVEDLTLIAGVHIHGSDIGNTTITGVHTPPAGAGLIVFEDIKLTSATDIFNSAAAGACNITLQTVEVNCTNGFTFNLLNWTGTLGAFSVADISTNNGFVSNTGGSAISVANTDVGAGAGQTMVISGNFFAEASDVHCPVSYVTGANFSYHACTFDRMQTLSNNSTGTITASRLSTGAAAAITQSSAGTLLIANSSITSSNNPALAGAGAGVINLAGVAFISDDHTAGTLTIVKAASFEVATLRSNDITSAGAITAVTGNITATAGNLVATAGSVSAGTTVTGGTGVTATTGNVVATAGQVNAGTTMTAGTGITATTGNIVATAGQVNAGTTMTAGTGITATTGNVVATAGQVNAGTTMTAGTGITATTGDIVATAGALSAGTTVTGGTGVTATTGNVSATAGMVVAGTVIRASGDVAGAAGTVSVSNVIDEALGAGAGTVLMKTGNPGNSSGWLKIYSEGNVRYIPYWTNISP